jgi:hypothetical protein
LRSIKGSTFTEGDSFKKKGLNHGQERKETGEIFLRRGGKITWNHNPANGNYYKIVVVEDGFRARLEYPINVECNEKEEPGGGGGNKFVGNIKIVDFIEQGKQVDYDWDAGYEQWWNTKFFRYHLKVTGLKPNTKHKLKFNGADFSHLCDTSVRETVIPSPPKFATSNDTWKDYSARVPDFFNDSPAGGIMTDQEGKIELYLYVLSDYSYRNKVYDRGGGYYNYTYSKTEAYYDTIDKPTILIQNDDKSSKASVVHQKKINVFSGVTDPKRYL